MHKFLIGALALPIATVSTPHLAVASEPAAQEETTNPDDVVKCRKIRITGSLVKSEKICKTVGEWRRLRESGNTAARDLTDFTRSRPAGE